MEKLIELLNEWYIERYGTNPHFVKFEDYGGNDYGYFVGDDKLMVETEVWTKKYGFIEWLVQNDKIDTDELLGIYWETRQSVWEANKYELYSAYKRLLMLLALQDNPIEFLISILNKNEELIFRQEDKEGENKSKDKTD